MKTIKSIDKAVQILDCFVEHEELGITEIVKLTGFAKSTIYDTVSTLVFHQYLSQNEENSKYSLGIRLFQLGGLFDKRNELTKRAAAQCQQLSEKWNATVHLAIPDHGNVIYIGKYEQQEGMVSASFIGKRLPMIATGLGKAMMAYLGQEYIEKYVLVKPFPKFTPNTIDNKIDLLADCQATLKRGYAIDNEEISIGLKCVAAPIFGAQGEVVAALSVSKLTPGMVEGDIERIAQDVTALARHLSTN